MKALIGTIARSAAGTALLSCLLVVPEVAWAGAAAKYLQNGDDWFASDGARAIAANIIAHQTEVGGWPKNVDTTTAVPESRDTPRATFDNGATTDELRFLARMFDPTHDQRYRQAFLRGLDHILHAQYANGGWPQYFPPGKAYPRHITFNDDTMVRLMLFLREAYTKKVYEFLDAERRAAAHRAFDRGIECILKCQITVDGKLTAWCAQHDEQDFSPRPARTYELPSLSGSETVGIVELMISLDSPSAAVMRSIDAAVAWLESAQLRGIRQVVAPDRNSPTGKNKIVVADPDAPPLWARFYEIGTNRAMFVDRDGVVKYNLADIGYERRNGYGWLGDRPRRLLERDYPAWKKKWSQQ